MSDNTVKNYRENAYSFADAFAILSEDAKRRKFDVSVECAFVLGIDPRKADQIVRGSVSLPHGTGKKVRVAVIAQGETAETATKAGADLVGYDDLMADIKSGKMEFDVLVTHPSNMAAVGKLGPKLGPRGLMPNPKDGTVTANLADAVKALKAGQVKFRNEKGGIVHTVVGKISFSESNLKENMETLISAIFKLKPSSAKGTYFKKVWLSTTMGPGLPLDLSDLKY